MASRWRNRAGRAAAATVSLVAAGLVLLMPAAPLRAGSETATLSVTATVETGCSLRGGSLDFGSYSSGQAEALDAVGQINFSNCYGTLRFELDSGLHGNEDARAMASGNSTLLYQIYRNSARNAIWGTGSRAHEMHLLIPQNGSIQVFGRIPGGQQVPTGVYTDIVNITLHF